jgi:hypothetical protein
MGQVGSLSYLPDKWVDHYELLLEDATHFSWHLEGRNTDRFQSRVKSVLRA